MNQSWKNRSKDPEYNARLVHAKDAHTSGCWIYAVRSGKLYTPREFLDSTEAVHIHRGKEDTARFKIVDPRGILAKILNNIQDQTNEAVELQRRINDYYEVVVKVKK